MNEEIIKPTYTKKPDFVTGLNNSEFYTFECLPCGNKLQLNCKTQIENSWTGKGENLNQQEYLELKKHYKIGIVNKSREGGFPVFDKVSCEKCQAEYYTYVGVDEPRNSVYYVQIQGIVRK
ncbi:MAG: hypothetical protein ACI8ZM_005238 [Crocinitomix sp.]|jgi:hypothetical protein